MDAVQKVPSWARGALGLSGFVIGRDSTPDIPVPTPINPYGRLTVYSADPVGNTQTLVNTLAGQATRAGQVAWA